MSVDRARRLVVEEGNIVVAGRRILRIAVEGILVEDIPVDRMRRIDRIDLVAADRVVLAAVELWEQTVVVHLV